jgi:hypothetical protein
VKKSRLYRINKFLGRTITGEKCPEIRWNDVVRIEAFGTDVVSAFAIMLIFQFADGSEVSVHPEQKGYYDIVESLDQRLPSIPAEWFEEMHAEGKERPDVRRVLYARSFESSAT